jgi:hypothetical protein
MVLREYKDIEYIFPEDEDTDSFEDEDYEVEEIVDSLDLMRSDFALKDEAKFDGDLINYYLAKCRETPLLNANEEKVLGGYIEEGRYLSRLEQKWITKNGTKPDGLEIVRILLTRFQKQKKLFEGVRRYLMLTDGGSIPDQVSQAELRNAIDGVIDQQLCDSVAAGMGIDINQSYKEVVQLSLDSRLIPWHLTGDLSFVDTMGGFEKS